MNGVICKMGISVDKGQRKKKWRQRQGFHNMVLSLSCILVFPCLLLIIFVQKVYIGQINSYVIKIAQDGQERVINEMDQLFENVELLAGSILLDEDFRKVYEPSDLSQARGMMSKLNILALNQKYITDILIYNSESSYLYSASSSYDKRVFCRVYHFEDMDEAEFFQYLAADGNGFLKAKRNEEPYLVFCRSRKNYVDSVGVIIMAKQRNLEKILEEQLGDSDGMTEVLDSDGNCLLYKTNDVDITPETYQAIVRKAEAKSGLSLDAVNEIVVYEGKQYIVTRNKSAMYGLQFVTVMTNDILLNQMILWQRLWKLLIMVTGIVGMASIVGISWGIYRPWDKLRTKADQINLTLNNSNEKDYERINQAMVYLYDNNSYLRNQMLIYHSYLLWKLIRGEIFTQEDEVQLSGVLGFEQGKTTLWNSIVRTHYMTAEGDVSEYLKSCLMEGNKFSVKELDGDNCFLVVWNVPNADENKLKEQLETVIKMDTDIDKISYSRGYQTYGKFAQALIEAWTTDELLDNGREIGSFENLECRTALEYRVKEISIAAASKDWQEIRKIVEIVCAKEMQETEYRYFCANLLLILKELKEYRAGVEESIDVLQILRCRDRMVLDHFLQNVIEWSDRILTGRNDKSDITLIDKMKVYLGRRYGDPNFMFQEMAEEYNMSLPALSKYFKEKTGMVINDYVTELKMNRAKYLLVNTDMAAADIALEVGYYNAASFSRRFRQIMGCSPSEYRKWKGKEQV